MSDFEDVFVSVVIIIFVIILFNCMCGKQPPVNDESDSDDVHNVGATDNKTFFRERQQSYNCHTSTVNFRPIRATETTEPNDRLTDPTPFYTTFINTGTTRTSLASNYPQTNTAGSRCREAIGTSPMNMAVVGSPHLLVDTQVNQIALESVQSVENSRISRLVTSVTNASRCTPTTILVGSRRTVISTSTPGNVGASNVSSFLGPSLPRPQIVPSTRISTSPTGPTGATLIYQTDGISAQKARASTPAPTTRNAAAELTIRTPAEPLNTRTTAAPPTRQVAEGAVARSTERSTQDFPGAHKTYVLPDSWGMVRRRTCARRTSVSRSSSSSSRPLTPTPPPSPPPKRPRTRLFEHYVENSEPEEKKLDLRGLFLREAMTTFFNFFGLMQDMYSSYGFKEEDRYIYVVTGYGKFSAGKKPVIKPAVQDFLDQNDIRHNWLNDGLVMIDFCSEEDEESDTESEESDSEEEVDNLEDEEDFEFVSDAGDGSDNNQRGSKK